MPALSDQFLPNGRVAPVTEPPRSGLVQSYVMSTFELGALVLVECCGFANLTWLHLLQDSENTIQVFRGSQL